MKKVLSYLMMATLVALAAMTGCNNENPEIEDEIEPIEQNEGVFIVDISKETDWDLMIVGNGGQSVFLNIDENAEMPTQLFCKPAKNSNAGFSVFFKKNGLPETMVVDGYIIYFGKFRNTLFDFSLIHPNNSIEYFYDIESGIDWDEFLESPISTRLLGINFRKVISATVNIVKVAVKVTLAAPLFMNPITVPAGIAAVISATPDLIRFADDLLGSVGIESPPFVSEIVDTANKIGTALDCATGNLVGCVTGIGGVIFNEATKNGETKDSKAQEIAQANSVINESGNVTSDPNFWNPQKGDVYVTGDCDDIATVWKNGIAQTLPGGTSSLAASIFVSGNDVFVVGNTNNNRAILWKNGIEQYLNDGTKTSYAHSVYVSGNDVYVAGWQDSGTIYSAILWKNGIEIPLYGDNVNSVFVSGNDVYVAGYLWKQRACHAVLWKNGIEQSLTDGTLSAQARSVYVSGSDVYVAGHEGRIAKVWKNGIAKSLSDGIESAETTSIYVSGDDVYVTGWESGELPQYPGEGIRFLRFWKNGVEQKLTKGTFYSETESVYVSGEDVYVAGCELSGNEFYNIEMGYRHSSVAKVWKNGVAQNLSDLSSNAHANSVFVVE